MTLVPNNWVEIMHSERAREDMAYITKGRHIAIAEKPLVRMLLYAIRNTWSLPPYTEFIIAQQIQYHKATKPRNNKFINRCSQLPTLHKWWKCTQWEVVGFDFIPCMWFQTLAKRNGCIKSDSTLTAHFQQYGSWWPLQLFPVFSEIYKNFGSFRMNWQVFAALPFFLTLF